MSTSAIPPNLENMDSSGGEPKDPVPPLPANNGSIPQVSAAEAWGTDKLPMDDGPMPFKNLRDGR